MNICTLMLLLLLLQFLCSPAGTTIRRVPPVERLIFELHFQMNHFGRWVSRPSRAHLLSWQGLQWAMGSGRATSTFYFQQVRQPKAARANVLCSLRGRSATVPPHLPPSVNESRPTALCSPLLVTSLSPGCRCSSQTEGSDPVDVLAPRQDRTDPAEGMLRLHLLHHVARVGPYCRGPPAGANAGRSPKPHCLFLRY